MLTLSPINNVKYCSDLATEDYYTQGGEPAGKWTGLGARYLNLTSQVDNADYHQILRGFARDGTPLCSNAGQDNRRNGWDLTFSAPKSLSILWSRADDNTQQAIQASQFKAVQDAVKFLERHAAFTRRGHDGLVQEQVLGLIAATFEHSTSRAQDPQLHTHCLIANIAPRHDGSFGTLDSHHLYTWKMAAGAVYRATLATQLRELGFEIEQLNSEPAFEVAGIPSRVCKHFSKRAAAIDAALESVGLETSASHAGSAFKLTTREHKQAVDRPALFTKWHAQLDELGLPVSQVDAIRNPQPQLFSQPLPLEMIIEQLTEQHAVFRLQDVYTSVANQAQFHHTTPQAIEAATQTLLEDAQLVALGQENKAQIFTTQSMLDSEQALIQMADTLSNQVHYQLDEQTIQIAINQQAHNQGFALSDEQVEAVFGACQSGLDIIQGAAGAGKSTSMQAVRLAHEAAGFKVRGAAVAKQAAKQLEDETGIPSSTLAKLLIELESGKTKLDNTAVVIDEAGQLSSLDLLTLTEAIHQAGGKLVLVGEQQQLDAISHGGALRYLSQRQGCARIEVIRRQREEWARQTVQHFRSGEADKALALHQQHGQLHMLDNSEQTRSALIRQWQYYTSSHPDKQSLILAQRWRDVKPLCDLIRQVYQARGEIGKENIQAECKVGNQHLYFAFSSGEHVRFTRNDYRRGFTNGQQGIIQKVEQLKDDIRFTITLDSGETVTFKQSDYCDEQGRLYLVQSYATTVYSSQGMTVDGDVFVHYTTSMDRAASYVAGSRHKDNCHWFINSEELDAFNGTKDRGVQDIAKLEQARLDTLKRCMGTNKQKLLASEYIFENDHNSVNQKTYEHEK
jgi:conjugative relaxase-like TrwC/TraI family protein